MGPEEYAAWLTRNGGGLASGQESELDLRLESNRGGREVAEKLSKV